VTIPIKNERISRVSYHLVLCHCSKPPSGDKYRKAPYPRTQQRVREGWKWNLGHAIVITRSL